VRQCPRGGPGEIASRVARAEQLLPEAGAAREPLALLVNVLRHQQQRITAAEVNAAAATARSGAEKHADRQPLLDFDTLIEAIDRELTIAVGSLSGAVPTPLVETGQVCLMLGVSERAALIETWLDDPLLVDSRLGFWLRSAAGPLLELAARDTPAVPQWRGAACPVCGGPPQASVIAEETGEFMAGSPRSLVCGRCATWWSFSRITCPACSEEDPRRIEAFLAEGKPCVRVDTCTTCDGYIKTFDFREKGGVDLVPLVDDVATLTLDVWAREQGFARAGVSLAGV
jgi:FdhE protein